MREHVASVGSSAVERRPRDGLGLFKPLARAVQWIEARYSMDGRASVNGLRNATQWIERCDAMDRTSLFNESTITLPSGAAKRTSVLLRKCFRLRSSYGGQAGGQRRGRAKRAVQTHGYGALGGASGWASTIRHLSPFQYPPVAQGLYWRVLIGLQAGLNHRPRQREKAKIGVGIRLK